MKWPAELPAATGEPGTLKHYDCHLDNMNITVPLLPQSMLIAEPLKNWKIALNSLCWELIAHKGMVLPLFFQLLNYLQGHFSAWTFAAETSEELRKWCGKCHCSSNYVKSVKNPILNPVFSWKVRKYKYIFLLFKVISECAFLQIPPFTSEIHPFFHQKRVVW